MCCKLHKSGLVTSPTCDCGQQQNVNHIVSTSLLTEFYGGLQLIHEADEDAVKSLESIASSITK